PPTPRQLPSFPTRRSSDLLTIRHVQVGKLVLVFEHRRAEATVHRLELLEHTGNGSRLLELLCDKLERIELPAPATALRLRAGPLDRKSTRLNSSHVKISYA